MKASTTCRQLLSINVDVCSHLSAVISMAQAIQTCVLVWKFSLNIILIGIQFKLWWAPCWRSKACLHWSSNQGLSLLRTRMTLVGTKHSTSSNKCSFKQAAATNAHSHNQQQQMLIQNLNKCSFKQPAAKNAHSNNQQQQMLIQDLNKCTFPDLNKCSFPGLNKCSFPGLNKCSFPGLNKCSFPGLNKCSFPDLNSRPIVAPGQVCPLSSES